MVSENHKQKRKAMFKKKKNEKKSKIRENKGSKAETN